MNRTSPFLSRKKRKSFFGQATTELLSVLPLMFVILGMIGAAGWWTYGRMNAISHTYFTSMQISSYNSLNRIDGYDDNLKRVSTGKPFWFDVDAYGSHDTFVLYLRVRVKDKIEVTYYVHGTILTVNPDKLTDNPSEYYIFFDSPVYQKYGAPKSTLSGVFCWYCSSDSRY
jgi:hypothetical protein